LILGWQLGSDSVVQVPNNVSNHLTNGLLKYFHTTGRFASGINLFEKLRTKNVEVSSLLAKILFMGNEEVQGIRVLHQAVKQSPMDYVMLDTQAEFLKKKALNPTFPELKEERLQMALGCADRSTIAAPSEFGTWARLAEIYVAMEDWENALTTLNSCPMFTYQDKDAPSMPEPRDVHLPTLPETRLDEIDSEPESRYGEQVHPSLLGLRAAQYRGTFKHAYSILTEMTAKIGWDQLLKIRSNVFVMEEEYRSEKLVEEPKKRNASTDVLRGTPDPPTNGSDAHEDDADMNKVENGSIAGETMVEKINGDEHTATADESVEKPEHTIDKDEVKGGNEDVSFHDESRSTF
jgi:Chs5-Arf1p-binding protein BUD7/BCH1